MRGVVEARQNRAGWAFVAPALVLIGVFFFVPVLAGLFLSFTDFDIYAIGRPDTARFMGLENYRQVLSNPLFWQALVITGHPGRATMDRSMTKRIENRVTMGRRIRRWTPGCKGPILCPWRREPGAMRSEVAARRSVLNHGGSDES